MKLNWKIALMCIAAIVMVACKKDKKEEEMSGKTDPSYVSPINVKDNSVADWDAIAPEKIASFDVTAAPLWGGLKHIKVYADEVYINYMLVFDPAKYVQHTSVDAMHIYMNADNDETTGGFFDSFADACADLMFEGSFYDDDENPISYSPTVHKWVGPVGGLPATRVGEWDEVWEAAGTIKGESQLVADSIFEGRLLVDLVPGGFAKDGFGIGFDLQQNWNNIGLLPQVNTKDGVMVGRTNMLYVPFNK